MSQRPINVIRYGSDAPLPEERTLHAGPLSLIYSEGDLRAIRLGEQEILNRVYVAVRDHNWDTIPLELSDVAIEDHGDSFRITYAADHRQDGIDFHWDGAITGAADGTVEFVMDGMARSTFRRNRIGFCVLHPAHLAGAACIVEHVGGSTEASVFPQQISPHQPFFDIRTIRHRVQPGVEAEVRMEGEIFEMEDQRNWTDASYKTYCTPLGLPFPVEIAAGTPVRQRVTLRLHGAATVSDSAAAAPLSFDVTNQVLGHLPQIGLGLSSQVRALDATTQARLRALQAAHLRVDLDLASVGWQDDLHRARTAADAAGASLEVALHLSNDAEAELAALRAVVDDLHPPIARWLVYHKDEKGIQAKWVELARQHLGDYDQTPLGAGTDAYFTELNRNPPPAAALDLVCYSINPQVHAFDNRSLMETLPLQATTVESARHLAGGKPLVISPITLRPRFNPNATGEETIVPGELPSQVDVRQMSLFGAAWTVGSLKAMAESGVASVTYYETVGWRGVMESPDGTPLPDRFPSQPGEVFPLYHVLADMAGCGGEPVLATASSDRGRVDGFALRCQGQTRVLLANLTNAVQEITVRHGGSAAQLRLLDEETAHAAATAPEAYRQDTAKAAAVQAGQTTLRLLPYAVARLDIEA